MKMRSVATSVARVVVGGLVTMATTTGCSSCGDREPAVESTTQATQADPAPSSTSVSLVGPKIRAPALKGALAPADGGK